MAARRRGCFRGARPATPRDDATGADVSSGRGNRQFLGELFFSLFFLLTSMAWLRSPRTSKWIGWVGVVTAVAGLLGMFRNVTGVVAPIAAVNNYLLPAFMIILGIALVRWPAVDDAAVP